MTVTDLTQAITKAVQEYIDNFDRFDSNPQIRINPVTLDVLLVNGSDMLDEIGDNDEAIEDAAAADGLRDEEGADYQVSQNPDFHPVKSLLGETPTGVNIPSPTAIASLASRYA